MEKGYKDYLVSIIMPAYNAATYISEAIASVLVQTYLNWELIIIDDGSTDSTSEIVFRYTQADTRIKYYYQENGKQGKARNLGISKSQGDLLAFLDADDVWLENKLKISVNLFKSTGCDLFFSEAYVFSDTSDFRDILFADKLGIVAGSYKGKEGLARLLYKNQIPLLTVLVKKEAVMAVNGFRDRGLAEDYELWLNLLAAGYNLTGFSIPTAAYRVHQHSSSSQDRLSVNAVSVMLTGFFKEHPEVESEFQPQIKVWLKRYIVNHHRSGNVLSEFPSIFHGFTFYIKSFRFFLSLEPILPKRLFNYFLNR